MEFFGLTSYGVSNPIRDMIRADYNEPKEPKELCLEEISKRHGSLTESIREVDVYVGIADGYAYRSFDRLSRMRKKRLLKPVGPSDMYQYPGTDSMNYGWWIQDEKLKNLSPEENWFKPKIVQSVPTSEMSSQPQIVGTWFLLVPTWLTIFATAVGGSSQILLSIGLSIGFILPFYTNFLKNTEEMSANKRWREQNTIKFVKLYKNAECLWNPRHSGYRDKKVREMASNEIIASMNMSDFGPNELKNKIKNIRSTYAQELNKVKRASIGMEGGENYRTSLCWFNIADSFLKPLVGGISTGTGEKKPKAGNLTYSEEEGRYIAIPSFNLTAAASGSNSPEMYYPPLNIDAEIIKTEILEEDDEDNAEYHHQSKKAKTEENGQIFLDNQDSNASSSGEVIQDEFYYFGKNIECQLRQLPLEKALECQFKILEVLAQYRVPT